MWSWDKRSNDCWAKSGISRKVKSPHFHSGGSCKSMSTIGMPRLYIFGVHFKLYQKHFRIINHIKSLDGCFTERNIDYPGVDIDLGNGLNNTKTEIWQNCQRLCERSPWCNAFSWDEQTKNCWLKSGISTKRSSSNYVSGGSCRNPLSKCWKLSFYWEYQNDSLSDCYTDRNIGYPGLDINLETGSKSDRTSSWQECQQLCYKRKGCNYYSWDRRFTNCWLKSGISEKVEDRAFVSGNSCKPFI